VVTNRTDEYRGPEMHLRECKAGPCIARLNEGASVVHARNGLPWRVGVVAVGGGGILGKKPEGGEFLGGDV